MESKFNDNFQYQKGGSKTINLTNKLNREVIVISDFEGEKIPEAANNEHYIICGDIIDSTAGAGSNVDYNVKIGDYDKHFNLNNIMKIINEPEKYTLIFGNRDINKFKTGPLTLLEAKNEKDKILAENFNNGEILLTQYNTLKDSTKFKWKASMNNWIPFWNNAVFTDEKIKFWKEENYEFKRYPFFERFNRIFGIDTAIGTMTAGNILFAIPKEILSNEEYTEICNEDLKKYNEKFNKAFDDYQKGRTTEKPEIYITQLNEKNENLEKLDRLAFITLAIFRTMCIPDNTIEIAKKAVYDTKEAISSATSKIMGKTKSIEISKELKIGMGTILNKTYLKGLLHKLYNAPNALFVGYIEKKDKLMLFSHGGITSDVMCGFNEQIDVLTKHIELSYNKLIQKGGAKQYTSNTIIKTLESMQNKYGNLLKTIMTQISNNTIPTKEMLLGMALSASYKPTEFPTEFVNYSSINPGIDILLANKFFCSDKDLIQIFGHVPKGFGTGLYEFKQNNKKLNLINLDISQSFKYGGAAAKTKNDLKIKQNGEIFINTTIDSSNIKNIDANFKNLSKNIDISEIKISDSLENIFRIYKEKTDEVYTYIYHGFYKDNEKEYLVYSKLKSYDKQIYIEEYNKNETFAGGNYKEKYLKYKQKYLQLKQSL